MDQSVELTAGGRKLAAERLREFVVGAIEAAPAYETPFYHLVLDHVFPDDVYAAILAFGLNEFRKTPVGFIPGVDRGYLVIHLGMTGKLLVNAEPTKYTHAIFTLDRGILHYDDQRQFGRIEYGDELPARVAALGPEPLVITLADFTARLPCSRCPPEARSGLTSRWA